MQAFDYTGVDRSGKRVRGVLDALNEGDVRMRLRSEGIRPTTIIQTGGIQSTIRGLFSARRISSRGLELFTKQLYLLTGSHLSILQSLDIMSEVYADEPLGAIVTDIKERMQQGVSFAEGLRAQGGLFPRFYTSLISTQEGVDQEPADVQGGHSLVSAQFILLLGRMVQYLEQERRLAQDMTRAVIEWAILMFGSLLILPAVCLYFVGDFFGVQLQLGLALHRYLGPSLLFLGACSYLFVRYLALPEGKDFRDRLLMRLPVMSSMARGWAVIQFARLMQLLLGSSVPLLEAVELAHYELGVHVTSHIMGSGWFQGTARFKRELDEGRSLAFLLGKTQLFSRALLQMISDGETRGQLDHAFGQVAKFQENDCTLQLSRVSPVRFL